MAELCHKYGLQLEVEAAGAQQAQKDPIFYSSKVDIHITEFWVQNFKPNGSFMDAISGGHIYNKREYSQRAKYMLQQGNFKADVLLFYSEGAQPDLNMAYRNNVLSYIPKGYRFDGCDANTILNRLKVKDHKLVLPNGASYRLLVLPENLQNTPVLLSKIKELVKAGAIIYGPKPLCSPSLMNFPDCDSIVRKLGDEV